MIKYDENHLYFTNKTVELPSTMEKIILFQDLYLILLKKCTRGKIYSQNSNLCAYDKNGDQLWVAEVPTTNPGDSYYKLFQEGEKIVAYSDRSYTCYIDPLTGKIIKKIFTK